jgi:pimeloyl-ACP methyl ester carboxylesterase
MVGDDIGVAGHSTGAEGALLAAEQDGRIDAVVSISPDKDSRVIMSNLSAINVPVLIISGSSDLIVNWRNSYDIYTQLSSTKEFICIRGAGHLDFLDGIFSSASKLSVAKKYTANWFRYFLQDDTSVESALFGSAAQADLTNRVLSVLEYTF